MNDELPLTTGQSQCAARAVPIAEALSRTFAREWKKISREDFLSVGHDAAVKAARTFDVRHGAAFESYAHVKINYAMVDLATRELRRARIIRDNLSGVLKDKWRIELVLTFDEMLGRPEPVRGDLVRDMKERAADLFAGTVGRGSETLSGGEDAFIDLVEKKDTILMLRAAVKKLDKEDREFVRLYYEEGLTPDEVGTRLGVGKRTVFRIQERVRAKLAEALKRPERAGK